MTITISSDAKWILGVFGAGFGLLLTTGIGAGCQMSAQLSALNREMGEVKTLIERHVADEQTHAENPAAGGGANDAGDH